MKKKTIKIIYIYIYIYKILHKFSTLSLVTGSRGEDITGTFFF